MPTPLLQDATAVVGIGSTPWSKSSPYTEETLALQAITAALDDAGIAASEVDGLSSYTLEKTEEVEIARDLGCGDLGYFGKVDYGGGAGCGVVGQASMAVATGVCNVAVAWRSRKRGSAASRPWAGVSRRIAGNAQWSRPFGLVRPVDEIAMLTQRYCHEYGATRDDLCNVAMAVRAHANLNPGAQMGAKTMTRDDYFAARMISEPLCLFDNCLETDGAAAVVIVAADRAKDCPQPPAFVHSWAQSLPRQHQTMTNYFCEDPLVGPAWACADMLWDRAVIGPGDVDVAQLYDAFSPLILLSLEGYGFCERGEAGDYVRERGIGPGGALPVNTSGGGMSEAYIHGFNLITEAVRQVRGTSTSQTPDAGWSLVTSGEGVPTGALLFRGQAAVISDAPLPAFDTRSTPFWEACNEGELRIQRCASCHRLRMPPRPLCPWCGSFGAEWTPSVGTGRVWSFVVPHPPLLPAFNDLAPYNVIVVQLDDDPGPDAPPIRLVGNMFDSPDGALGDIDPATIEIGEAVRVVFGPTVTDEDGSVTLPRWVRV